MNFQYNIPGGDNAFSEGDGGEKGGVRKLFGVPDILSVLRLMGSWLHKLLLILKWFLETVQIYVFVHLMRFVMRQWCITKCFQGKIVFVKMWFV